VAFRRSGMAAYGASIGFLPASGGAGPQKILGIGEAQADSSLKNARIKIALNALRVADYPGGGTHRVLFDFYARNQVPGGSEICISARATGRARASTRQSVAT
jgi:hypothetical protein